MFLGRRFSISRSIRGKLWTCMGGKRFTAKELLDKYETWSSYEPDLKRRTLMKKIAMRWNDKDYKWQNEKGIGPWTICAHQIMCGDDPNMILKGDAHIQNAMKGITTWQQLKEHMPNQLTQLTRFFWRLSTRGRLYILTCLHNVSEEIEFGARHFF
jgi:hypothetical protein